MKKWLFRTAAVMLAILIPACLCAAEGALPPSPEPPPATIERPTPAPTAVPTDTIIDHVHHPEQYPGFAFRQDRKILDIWFPNIKDADAAILTYDGKVWMIDCADGKSADKCVLLIRQLGITDIDILFNSHPHHDHIDGLEKTAGAAQIGEIRICFPPTETESGLRMMQTALDKKIPVKEYKDGDTFAMGDGAVGMLVLKNNEEELDVNNRSALMMISYGDRRILFTADIEFPGQEAMIARIDPELLKCDIVKYPHHAKSYIYPPFFDAMDAKLAIVTAFEGRPDAGQRDLSNRRIPTVYTSVKGRFIHLATDGEYWLCEEVPVTEQQTESRRK